jgi:hypothetical protein
VLEIYISLHLVVKWPNFDINLDLDEAFMLMEGLCFDNANAVDFVDLCYLVNCNVLFFYFNC